MTKSLNIRLYSICSIHSTLCALLIGGLLVGAGTAPAVAQATQGSGATASAGEAPTTAELVERLASPRDAERFEALRQVVVLAQFSPEAGSLIPTVPALTTVYKEDPSATNRLVAVVALAALGDEAGLRQVRRRFLTDPSLMVQYVSLHALLDHYGPGVFAKDPAALALAENVLARKREKGRLGQMRRAVPTVAEQR